MTELERARAHLRECQLGLLWERKFSHPINGVPHNEHVGQCQERVLAALSWVWEAQNREQGFSRMLMSETVAFRELYCQEWYIGGADGEMRYERRGLNLDTWNREGLLAELGQMLDDDGLKLAAEVLVNHPVGPLHAPA